MGGRDVQGLRHADPSILANCPLIIFDPSPPYLSFFKSCSFVPIVCPSYAQHDEWMAHVSHGPYLLATLLPSLLSQSPPDYLDALRRISAGGFRDTTRVANSPVEWGLDIVQGNQSALVSFLSDIEAQITTLKTVIQSGDSTALANHLKLAKQTRARITDSPTAT